MAHLQTTLSKSHRTRPGSPGAGSSPGQQRGVGRECIQEAFLSVPMPKPECGPPAGVPWFAGAVNVSTQVWTVPGVPAGGEGVRTLEAAPILHE